MAREQPLILVVDDDQDLREVIRQFLTDERYSVRTAPDGEAALASAAQVTPALILLNVRMPVLDGRGFTQAYRRMPGPHTPIILVSAVNNLAEVAQEMGVEEYLAKPFQLDDLLQAVNRHLRPVD